MAFIEKTDPVVLNIKLTTKGRELLSTGNLSFKYFAIGDSEIDYTFDKATGLNPFNANILRPVDNNPKILSFIPKTLSGDPYNVISSIPASTYLVTNNAGSIGFFTNLTGNTFTFIVDGNHIKQPDVMINMSGIAGGTTLNLLKAPAYGTSGNEPAIGDLLLVKWTVNKDTTGYTSQKSYPTPYLIYKITSKTGTLGANNLVVTVDRKIPNFTGMGATAKAGAMILYNYINFSGSTIFTDLSSDYLDESVLTFLQNSQCPTVIFPFWNMSIIFTDEIAGVQLGNKTYAEFNTKGYGGFVSYIQNQQPYYRKLGVIHYTNDSPANVYAEGFYLNTAVLDVPTIMWHKSAIPKLGAKFIAASGNGYTLINLGIHYYDLVDASNPTVIVGKVFDELKMFLIEDQELLYAMSYKSNRSWTLSNFMLGGGNSNNCPPPPPVIVLPTVFTNTITAIGYYTATGGGNVTSDGGGTVTARGVVWSTSSNPTIDNNLGKTTNGLGTGTFISSLTSLVAGTTYSVRAYATNEAETAYGTQVSFKTGTPPVPPTPVAPSVTTNVITDITQITATGGGNVTSDGGATVTARGVVWSTSPSPTTANSKTTDSSGTGGFTSSLTGLAASTAFYVRAYATNSVDTSYGEQVKFTTAPATPTPVAPSVTTSAITDITQNTATGGGNVTDDGGATVTARGVVWSTNQNPTTADMKTIDGLGTGAFTSSIAGLLTAGTTYNVRAYATNSAGTAYGIQVPFTTATIIIPNVTTSTVDQITETTARGIGNIGYNGGTPVTISGFVWGTSLNPTIADNKTTDGPTTAPALFCSNLTTGLIAGTAYYARAYATNSVGTGYGDNQSFTTCAIPITNVTIAYSAPGSGSALSGSLVITPAIPAGEWACVSISYNQKTIQPATGVGRAIICCNGTNVSTIDTSGKCFCSSSPIGNGSGLLKINSGDVITWCNSTTAGVGSCSCIGISTYLKSDGINVTTSGCSCAVK